jgi:hypothetical protein
MAQLSELLPLLREKCNGMLDQQAIDQLKKAYRNFCLQSGYIQQTDTVSRLGDGSVLLNPEFDHYIGSINVVIETKGGRELKKGIGYKVDSSNNVTIAQGYDEVQITYSVVPTLPMDDSIEINDDIFQRWPDELAAGAASLLRMIPERPWTSPSLADFYQRDFVKGHREAFQLRVAANDEIQFQPQSNRNFF